MQMQTAVERLSLLPRQLLSLGSSFKGLGDDTLTEVCSNRLRSLGPAFYLHFSPVSCESSIAALQLSLALRCQHGLLQAFYLIRWEYAGLMNSPSLASCRWRHDPLSASNCKLCLCNWP